MPYKRNKFIIIHCITRFQPCRQQRFDHILLQHISDQNECWHYAAGANHQFGLSNFINNENFTRAHRTLWWLHIEVRRVPTYDLLLDHSDQWIARSDRAIGPIADVRKQTSTLAKGAIQQSKVKWNGNSVICITHDVYSVHATLPKASFPHHVR